MSFPFPNPFEDLFPCMTMIDGEIVPCPSPGPIVADPVVVVTIPLPDDVLLAPTLPPILPGPEVELPPADDPPAETPAEPSEPAPAPADPVEADDAGTDPVVVDAVEVPEIEVAPEPTPVDRSGDVDTSVVREAPGEAAMQPARSSSFERPSRTASASESADSVSRQTTVANEVAVSEPQPQPATPSRVDWLWVAILASVGTLSVAGALTLGMSLGRRTS